MNALCLQSDQNKSQNVLKTLHRMSKQVPLGRQLGMKHLHLALNLNTNLSLQYKNIIFLGKAGVGFLPSCEILFSIGAGLSHCQGVDSHGRRYCISSSDKSNSIICNWRRKTDLSQALRAWRGFYPGERQVSVFILLLLLYWFPSVGSPHCNLAMGWSASQVTDKVIQYSIVVFECKTNSSFSYGILYVTGLNIE